VREQKFLNNDAAEEAGKVKINRIALFESFERIYIFPSQENPLHVLVYYVAPLATTLEN
jgi:hypothetical protein